MYAAGRRDFIDSGKRGGERERDKETWDRERSVRDCGWHARGVGMEDRVLQQHDIVKAD